MGDMSEMLLFEGYQQALDNSSEFDLLYHPPENPMNDFLHRRGYRGLERRIEGRGRERGPGRKVDEWQQKEDSMRDISEGQYAIHESRDNEYEPEQTRNQKQNNNMGGEQQKDDGIVLPMEVTLVQSVNPRNLLLFGLQKCGKTTALANLPGNLIIDTEVEGTEFVSALKLKVPKDRGPASKMKWLKDVAAKIRAAGCPYDYVTIDTLTEVDEWAEWSGTRLYMGSIAGQKFNRVLDGMGRPEIDKATGKSIEYASNDPNYLSVHTLEWGYGYKWSRQEMTEVYDLFQSIGKICTIFVCHVVDKNVISKLTSTEVKTMDVSLTGKVKDIIGRRVTGIGYVYNKDGVVMISFKGNEDKIGGIRSAHIRGYEGPLLWSKIFIGTSLNELI